MNVVVFDPSLIDKWHHARARRLWALAREKCPCPEQCCFLAATIFLSGQAGGELCLFKKVSQSVRRNYDKFAGL